MGRYINPFTDWGFKYLFGQDPSKELLIDFLNCLLTGEREIVDLEFLDKEQSPEFQKQRGIIYDIYCRTSTGEHIIVEMQNRSQKHFKERALFYLSKSIVSQGRKGDEWDYSVKAVYGVFFLNFLMSDSPGRFRTDVALTDMKTHEVFCDRMRMIFLELPRFKKSENECENDFERWIFILKHMEALSKLPFTAQKEIFKKLAHRAEAGLMDEQERDQYEESLKIYRDNRATYDYAVETGMEEGMRKGWREGREKGMKEGVMKVACNMLKMGLSSQDVAKATGLSLDEVEKIRRE